jgi:hypothetical protein
MRRQAGTLREAPFLTEHFVAGYFLVLDPKILASGIG